jgi:hypothetical protein
MHVVWIFRKTTEKKELTIMEISWMKYDLLLRSSRMHILCMEHHLMHVRVRRILMEKRINKMAFSHDVN